MVRRNWKLDSRVLEEHELVYFPIGTGAVYQIGDRTLTIDRPCWIMTRAGCAHCWRFSESSATRHLFLHFSADDGQFPHLLRENGPDLLPAPESSFHASLISYLLEVTYLEKNGRRSGMLLASLLNELDHLAARRNAPPDEPDPQAAGSPYSLVVSKAIHYIKRHLAQPITAQAIAEHCRISHEHLSRLFVREVGIPPRQMIIQLRLERAAHQLRHSTLSINEIAERCGFSENHYFSRTFASHFGLSASAYRAKYAVQDGQHVDCDETIEEKYPINAYIRLTP
ncbi:helix-turn-helix transcriptional regulator [Paenibacillus sp. MWE-103]|uniref:Helix-turn-helix transcriptional regulator n=1 Tax=Paenibacillus artemisiicola TaxID=1172618 RepID=A0ABS3WI06_9BACL|nr:helix-turn-helix transcriptional regulator [Paenibacillus artemisiicola]